MLQQIKVASTQGARLPGLRVLASLFDELNVQGIRYCHWKSTHGLPKALGGATDLDLLVDRSHSRRFKQLLYRLDFKPALSHPRRQFPAIEDYLGFDEETGGLAHLHIHYRVVLGEEFVKNYDLPLERCLLDNTRMELGLRVPAPELEIIVLALRTLLKHSHGGGISPSTRAEFAYLLGQATSEQVAGALTEHAGFITPGLVTGVLSALESPMPSEVLDRLAHQARRELAPYQRHSRWRARAISYQAALAQRWPFSALYRRLLAGRDKRKIPIAGGLGIAFVGADGAGKSTIVHAIGKWLSWRLNVQTFYMGTSRPSPTTRAVRGAAQVLALAHAGCRRLTGEASRASRLAGRLRRAAEYLRCLADARDRRARYLAGRRAVARGSIVVYDRYPLEAIRITGRAMDGPRIAALGNVYMNPLAAAMARLEARIYLSILPPEHVFALRVSPAVSQARKPEHDSARIAAKSQAIVEMAREGLRVTEIDADQPLDQVLLQIKTAIWHLI